MLTLDQLLARKFTTAGMSPDGFQNAALSRSFQDLARAIGYQGQAIAPTTYMDGGEGESGSWMREVQGEALTPEFRQALSQYRFNTQERGDGRSNISIFDATGNPVSTYAHGDKDSAFDKLASKAIPLGLAALAGGAAMGAFGGAPAAGTITGGSGLTAGGSAGYGTIGGTLGGTGGTTLGVAGGGLSAGAGLTSPLLQSLGAISAGSVLPASLQPMGGLLDGLPAIAADPLPAIEAFTAANPVAVPELLAGVPEIVAPAVSAAPSVFNAAADSQAYNAAAGITGAEAAAAANVPATVNLANAGGAMSTAGGLSGLLQSGGQMAADAVGAAKDAISPTLQWMKDNPTLGRLLLGGATSLLSSAGGGGSQAVAEAPAGPPVQWKSPIQHGLLAPVQQYAPEAIQKRPAGLLASGYENDGAWRYLRG